MPQDSNHGIGTKGLSRFEAEIEGIMGNNYIYTCIEEIRRECYIPIFPIIMKLFSIDVTHNLYIDTRFELLNSEVSYPSLSGNIWPIKQC